MVKALRSMGKSDPQNNASFYSGDSTVYGQ